MAKKSQYDFSGYVTRNNIRCSDGRTIMQDAFKGNDGGVVPLVWNHRHGDASDVLGHVLLENRADGVYGYGSFNGTEEGLRAKELVSHGDITSMSIYANQLKQADGYVSHGIIREVSLVYAGANPGAFIDSVIVHGEESQDEAFIYSGEDFELCHADTSEEKEPPKASEAKEESKPTTKQEEKEMAQEPENSGKTLKEIFDTFTDEQKQVVYALVGAAVEDAKGGASDGEDSAKHSDDEGENSMKHNLFEGDPAAQDDTLSHAEELEIIKDGKRFGSMRESALQHGISDIEYLFPDAKALTPTPVFIKRPDEWATRFLNGVKHTPFARIKTLAADITEADARARGYVKGHQKVDEVFGLLKRTTDPQMIYKKQTMDRDDVIDITDFDVIAWLKTEMRGMLNEEIARAALVGDGRSAGADGKISADHIRPVWTDDELYTIHYTNEYTNSMTTDARCKLFIRGCVKARKEYRGSGNPILFTTEDMLSDLLLMEDTTGRVIYKTVEELKNALRVSDILTVPVMENQSREGTGEQAGDTLYLDGIMLNLADYNIGADKGGSVNMFDDFDIDYNQQKYLIETKCSGALVKPKSAIVIEHSFQ